MAKVNGDGFYKFRALHFQHTYGNLNEMDANTAIMRQISGPEKERWGELAGTIRQDAFAELVQHCETLRQSDPTLFT